MSELVEAPLEMFHKFVRLLDHFSEKDQGFLDLQRSESGSGARVKNMIDPSTVPSEALAAAVGQNPHNAKIWDQLTISYGSLRVSSPCY